MKIRTCILIASILPMLASADAPLGSVVQAFPHNVGTGYQLVVERHAAPDYPRRALGREQGGWVDIQFTVSANGDVEDVQIMDAEPRRIFERAALRAAMKWRFAAPADQGLSSSQKGTFRFQFAIE